MSELFYGMFFLFMLLATLWQINEFLDYFFYLLTRFVERVRKNKSTHKR